MKGPGGIRQWSLSLWDLSQYLLTYSLLCERSEQIARVKYPLSGEDYSYTGNSGKCLGCGQEEPCFRSDRHSGKEPKKSGQN